MKNATLNQLKQLISEKRFDEAKTALHDYINQMELTEEEKGAVLVNFTSLYMKVLSDINANYEEELDAIIAALKDLDAKESLLNDKIDLAAVRSKIKGEKI